MKGSELSLRHLPDLSDASFSFQIPTDAPGDLLLSEKGDFLGGGEDGLASLSLPRANDGLLTLSQLTPKPRATPPVSTATIATKAPLSLQPTTRSNIRPSRPPPIESKVPKPHSNNRQVRGVISNDVAAFPADESSTPANGIIPRKEAVILSENRPVVDVPNAVDVDESKVTLLVNRTLPSLPTEPTASDQPSADALKKQPPRSKKSVISGGIAKSKHVRKETKTAAVPPNPPPHAPAIAHPDNEESSSAAPVGGMGIADRLLMYGEKWMMGLGSGSAPSDSEHDDLIVGSHTSSEAPIVIGGTSIGIPASREDDPSLTQTHDPVVVARDEAQDPLTLSQLSPWKRDSTTAAPDPEAEVGMDVDREEPPTRKRPASPSPIVSCESKKGKFEKLGVLGVGVPPRAPSTKRARPPARTASVNQSRAQTKRASKVRARDVSLAKVAESTRVQKSAGSTSSRSLKRTDNSSAITSGVASSSAITQSSSEKDKKKVTVPQSIASATVSVAFNYQLDAKKDVRREDGSRPASSGSTNRKASSHAVPDFKSLHASLDAQRAIRRVTPTVPIPIVFHTDVRAKEREAFDEQVREKEREREAEKELTQREREEEEVREVRELRKRAVPKAHEVPAWYKDVPRTRRENGASQK